MVAPPPESVHPLAVALSSTQPRLGYFYLHYLSEHSDGRNLEPYTVFADIFEDLSLRECLAKDLKVCQKLSLNLFYVLCHCWQAICHCRML